MQPVKINQAGGTPLKLSNTVDDGHNHSHDHNERHHEEGAGAEHNHSREHSDGGVGHNHLPSNLGFAFKFGLVLTLTFVVGEFIAGLLSNSLALISDAGHNLSDALALAFSWWALRLASRSPNFNKTYGYHRAGILAATVNAVTLILIAVYIFYEGVQRLFNPPEVAGWTVIVVATFALIINLVVAWLLHAGSKEDLNARSAFVHIAGDAAASVGVILAGVIEVVVGWRLADPIISMLIGVVILWSSWGIIKEATNILLEGIPAGLDMVNLTRDLLKQPGVKDVHDLHVWTIGSGFKVLSCHLKLINNCSLLEAGQTAQPIKQMLEAHYDIRHCTLELECQGCDMDDIYCGKPNNSTITPN